MGTPEATTAISPFWDLVSVITEVVAFFLVTIDLYGEERLAALNDWIARFLSRMLAGKWRKLIPEEEPDPIRYGSAAGFILRLICFAIVYPMSRWPVEGASPFLTPILLFGRWMCVFFAVVFAVGIVLDLIVFTSAFALWLVTKLRFKGILLTCGALLFIFAKGILIAHSLNELHVRLPWPLKLF